VNSCPGRDRGPGRQGPAIRDRRRRTVLGAALSLALAGAGVTLVATGLHGSATSPPEPPPPASSPLREEPVGTARPAVTTAPAAPAVTTAPATTDAALPRSRPVRLDIPSIGVATRLTTVGLNRDRTIEVPPLTADAPPGWYRYLASPGENGPAVIVGHVDSARDGPAVFYRLSALRPGDRIDVTRADGTVAHFRVTQVVSVAKEHFPSAAVYGDVARPEMRLVTCGGSFDRRRGRYRDNVIAFARLTGMTRAAAVPVTPVPTTGLQRDARSARARPPTYASAVFGMARSS
jgi:hypothetical protein